MLKAHFAVLSLAVFLLAPVIASAIAPPDDIAKWNLDAELVIAGKVVELRAEDTPPHFILQPVHIIKGFKKIKKEDCIKILSGPRQTEDGEKIVRHTQGTLPVKVEEGAVVVVYINPSDKVPGFFKPVLDGLSVVTISQTTDGKTR